MSDAPYILDGLTGERRPAPRMTPDQALIARIQSALGTGEDGDGLVEVAQNAHAAEQALAAVVLRARENPTEHVAHALRAVKVD